MVEKYYDLLSDATQDCFAFAANYGFPGSFCNYGGDSYSDFGGVGAGWLCAFGPTGCKEGGPYYFYAFSGSVCNVIGNRYFQPPINRCVPVRDRYHDKPDACLANVGFGNPIYPLTGSKRYSVELGTWFGGLLQLQYDTRRKIPANGSGEKFSGVAAAAFGELWETGIHKKLIIQSGPVKTIQASRGLGVWVSFVGGQAGNYLPDIDVNDRLAPFSGGWRYVDAISNSEEIYDGNGRLMSISGSDGSIIILTYSDTTTSLAVAPVTGLLIQAQDQYGRSAQFSYEQPAARGLAPRVIRMVAPDRQITRFSYDAAGNLIMIVWPDSSQRRFLYAHADIAWALTGVIDEKGLMTSSYFYDGAGRATATQNAGGVNYHAVAWTTPPGWKITETYDAAAGVIWRDHIWATPEGTVVTLPNGQTTRLTISNVAGMPRLGSQTQGAGSGCAASNNNRAFDAHGNVVQADGFNGYRVCYGFDTGRNLEIARVEGLDGGAVCAASLPAGSALPTGSRKISSQWHPDWRLVTKSAEAGRVVTTVYNGQPDPFNGGALAACAPAAAVLPDGKPIAVQCRRVEQATSDTDGSSGFVAPLAAVVPREHRWAYNLDGQVLRHDGPRTDVADVTSYAYYSDTTADHTRGDLQTLTNPAGHVTNYLRYNPAGKLLTMEDPNGVTTTYTYDLRQRLTSTTVGSSTTVYSYDVAGQLVQVTSPDGTFAGYIYDDAHRLVAVYDNLGNRIDYTLDVAGKQLAERVNDDSGLLRRQLSRSFDALGRPQQIIGRE